MRTLFILSIITVAALGQVLNSDTNNSNENLQNFQRVLQSMFANATASFVELQSYIMKIQDDLSIQESDLAPCANVKKDGVSGISVYFLINRIIPVYCDQSTDNGGWMLIQRRQDGSVDFYRDWKQYEAGFGNLRGEFWFGLANLHALTESKHFKLRIELTDFYGNTAFAVYNKFNISRADDNYRLHVEGYSGTAGDGLEVQNSMQFTTRDKDNDFDDGNCAEQWHGAWWYAQCGQSNLNGLYKADGAPGYDGVNWHRWKSDWRSFKRVEMKIRT